MASVATEFVGPRPGCYIMKFCQGATEMVFRFIVVVFGVGAFITSAVALGLLQGLPRFTDVTSRATISREIPGSNPETLFLNSYLGGGIGITAATLTIIYEIIFIVLRFLNIGLINLKIKIFLIIDIVVGLVLAILLNASGVLGAYMANEWSKVLELGNGVTEARNSLAALCAFALFDGVCLALLETWMLVFLIRKWNEKVIKETVKDVI